MPSIDVLNVPTEGLSICQTIGLVIVLAVAVACFAFVVEMRRTSSVMVAAPEVWAGNQNTAPRRTLTTTETAAAATGHPPLFILVGDSTTADQAVDGGGWGAGFSSFLARGARGINKGINGATTKGYINSGIWDNVIDIVRTDATFTKVYVTIQFGHNDQLPVCGVSLDEYRGYLVKMARDVLEAGGTPILVTPLARRDFSDGIVVDNLKDYRIATLEAYMQVLDSEDEDEDETNAEKKALTAANHVRCINLNAASLAYVDALGAEASQEYNLHGPGGFDTTHLSEHGSLVFGRMVADLILGHPPELVKSGTRDKWTPGTGDEDGLYAWIRPEPFLTGLIWHGKPA